MSENVQQKIDWNSVCSHFFGYFSSILEAGGSWCEYWCWRKQKEQLAVVEAWWILLRSLLSQGLSFFSWPRAPRAYLFRKLNSWICCVCFFRNLLLDFGNPIDKTFHSWEDSWSVSENWIKNSAQFEQLTHCHSQCRSWPPPPGWTCHLNPGIGQRQFKWKKRFN